MVLYDKLKTNTHIRIHVHAEEASAGSEGSSLRCRGEDGTSFVESGRMHSEVFIIRYRTLDQSGYIWRLGDSGR